MDLLGALYMSRGDVGGIDHVLGRSQGGLRQVVVDLLGQLAVLDRGDRGGDVHHDLGPLFLAGLGVVDPYNAKGNFEFEVTAGLTADLRTRSPRGADA
ncbi:hypothetical protein, partial [Streptomyces mirabilis]|uniref:hypothetical protein n=1 Tax=Streptomyces mirabilis TaxID=68239 RepID=UPI0033EEC558